MDTGLPDTCAEFKGSVSTAARITYTLPLAEQVEQGYEEAHGSMR